MIQSSTSLLILVIFGEVVKCWSWAHSLSPSGDPVHPGPTPLSLIKCLHAREFSCIFTFAFPRRTLVIFLIHAVGPRYSFALCNRRKIEIHSYPCLCHCFHCLLCPTHRANQVCCPWNMSYLLSLFRYLFGHSSTHQLLFHDATSLIRWVLFCLPTPLPAMQDLHGIAHTSSYDMSLLVCESLCVVSASCVSPLVKSP